MESNQIKFCIRIGELGIRVKYSGKPKFQVVVPCCSFNIPLSVWYDSYPEVCSFLQGLNTGFELTAIGVDYLADAQCSYHQAINEAAHIAPHINITGVVYQECTR